MPIIGAWALCRSLFDFSVAAMTRPQWPLVTSGVVSLCFAPLFFTVRSETAALYALALYAAITGLLLFACNRIGEMIVTPRRGST